MFATLITTLLAAQAVLAAPVNIQKRFSGDATYYEVGLGACGHTNSGTEYVVAMNAAQYAGGSLCGQTVTISANGRSAQATVVDLCPGCAFGALDLSESLFTFFNPTSVGRFTIDWTLGGGGGGGGGGEQKPSPSPEPQPQPTSTYTPPPPESTTSSTPPPPPPSSSTTTTTTDAASSTTTSLVPSSSSSIVSSSTISLNVTSTLNSTAVAAPTVSLNSTTISNTNPDASVINHDGDSSGNLAGVSNLVASLGRLVVLAASS
ncbi:hypothetical protein Q8F55_009139 [Vanrija albida]|uniref:RlpA-like protein double-psi beta-barrel domain-containing protein n=1 Tax=Vanrija albida TaxID=181172 RepID=A0ABR3PST8_9TREE